jgi:hypothetical protein
MYVGTYQVILTEVEKQGVKVRIGRLERLVAVQGFGRPVTQKGSQYERKFPSGSSIKSFTPGTADMSVALKSRQDGDMKENIV